MISGDGDGEVIICRDFDFDKTGFEVARVPGSESTGGGGVKVEVGNVLDPVGDFASPVADVRGMSRSCRTTTRSASLPSVLCVKLAPM